MKKSITACKGKQVQMLYCHFYILSYIVYINDECLFVIV